MWRTAWQQTRVLCERVAYCSPLQCARGHSGKHLLLISSPQWNRKQEPRDRFVKKWVIRWIHCNITFYTSWGRYLFNIRTTASFPPPSPSPRALLDVSEMFPQSSLPKLRKDFEKKKTSRRTLECASGNQAALHKTTENADVSIAICLNSTRHDGLDPTHTLRYLASSLQLPDRVNTQRQSAPLPQKRQIERKLCVN